MTTAVDKNVIYVFGGDTTDIGSGQWLSNVESYDIEGNAWTDEASMLVARGWAAAGLFGTVIVAADGNPGPPKYMTGDNEAYNVKTNKWSELQADPTPRDAPCYSAIGGKLYIAGGENGNLLTLTEAYTPSTKSWSTLASMPKGVVTPVNAVVGGRLYCIGGGNALDNIPVDYVQVYQP
jgi:N-acetylneuraminic acid mutarotase